MKAIYDHRPKAIEAVGNGSYLYRRNIERNDEREREEFRCEEVAVWGPLDSDKILEIVIADVCPLSREQKLINEFNSLALGVIPDERGNEIKTAYKEFLELRLRLKNEVEAAWAEYEKEESL